MYMYVIWLNLPVGFSFSYSRDAEVMRLKQQKANEKKNEPSAGASK